MKKFILLLFMGAFLFLVAPEKSFDNDIVFADNMENIVENLDENITHVDNVNFIDREVQVLQTYNSNKIYEIYSNYEFEHWQQLDMKDKNVAKYILNSRRGHYLGKCTNITKSENKELIALKYKKHNRRDPEQFSGGELANLTASHKASWQNNKRGPELVSGGELNNNI